MTCVPTVTYSYMVNGNIVGFFPGKKGLRQGDPLSPYLFVLVMEYFNRMVRKMARNSAFRYHPQLNKLGIVNITFADDLMLFVKAKEDSLLVLKQCLNVFVTASPIS